MPTVDHTLSLHYDMQDRILDVSAALASRIGVSPDNLIGRPLISLITTPLQKQFAAVRDGYANGGFQDDLVWQFTTAADHDPFFATLHFSWPDGGTQGIIHLDPVDEARARYVMMHLPHAMNLAQQYLRHDVISPLRMSGHVLNQISGTCAPETQKVIEAVQERLTRISDDIERFAGIGLLAVPRQHTSAAVLAETAAKVLSDYFAEGSFTVDILSGSNIQPAVFAGILENLLTVLNSRVDYSQAELVLKDGKLTVTLTLRATVQDPEEALEQARNSSARNRFLVEWKRILLLRHDIELTVIPRASTGDA